MARTGLLLERLSHLNQATIDDCGRSKLTDEIDTVLALLDGEYVPEKTFLAMTERQTQWLIGKDTLTLSKTVEAYIRALESSAGTCQELSATGVAKWASISPTQVNRFLSQALPYRDVATTVGRLLQASWVAGAKVDAVKKAVQKNDWATLAKYAATYRPTTEWLTHQAAYVKRLSDPRKLLLLWWTEHGDEFLTGTARGTANVHTLAESLKYEGVWLPAYEEVETPDKHIPVGVFALLPTDLAAKARKETLAPFGGEVRDLWRAMLHAQPIAFERDKAVNPVVLHVVNAFWKHLTEDEVKKALVFLEAELNHIIQAAPVLDKAIQVYRGVGSWDWLQRRGQREPIVLNAPTGTSLDAYVALEFHESACSKSGHAGTGGVMRIQLSAGTKVLCVPCLPGTQKEHEQEMLLPRGTSLLLQGENVRKVGCELRATVVPTVSVLTFRTA